MKGHVGFFDIDNFVAALLFCFDMLAIKFRIILQRRNGVPGVGIILSFKMLDDAFIINVLGNEVSGSVVDRRYPTKSLLPRRFLSGGISQTDKTQNIGKHRSLRTNRHLELSVKAPDGGTVPAWPVLDVGRKT